MLSRVFTSTQGAGRRALVHISMRSMATGNDKTVGFIGLGNMGLPMAQNLAKNGFSVKGFDLSEGQIDKLVSEGGAKAATPADAADGADVIVTMLPTGAHVEAALQGKDGAFESMKSGTLLIDSSTIDPMTVRKLAETASASGSELMDAPVSGGTLGAEAGTLTFMCGAEQTTFDRAQAVLQAMGKNIVLCGGPGNGQIAKLCNNLLLGISMAGVSEAYTLGIRLGADPKVLANIINTSSGRCWSSDTYNPVPGVMEGVPASRDYAGGFACDLMSKDMGLALAAGTSVKAPTPLGATAHQLYQIMSANGNGGKDFGGIFQMLQKKE